MIYFLIVVHELFLKKTRKKRLFVPLYLEIEKIERERKKGPGQREDGRCRPTWVSEYFLFFIFLFFF